MSCSYPLIPPNRFSYSSTNYREHLFMYLVVPGGAYFCGIIGRKKDRCKVKNVFIFKRTKNKP